MAKGCSTSTYEEARKRRLEENKKRFEELGISKISKNLTKLTSSEKKSLQHHPKLKSKSNVVVEPRRSSRMRNSVPSYRDDVSIDLPPLRKRSRSNSSTWGSYVARPINELKEATEEERTRAFKAAEELQSDLQSSNPSFVKSMLRSHVYSCFWLGLPTKFCEEHLPKTAHDMILEDENGSEYEAIYIGNRTGLSGGWRAFALDHKLDDGDALVFELIEPARFKIYIIRAFLVSTEVDDVKEDLADGNTCATKAPKAAKKHESKSNKAQKLKQGIVYENNKSTSSQEHLPESYINNEVKQRAVNPDKKTKFAKKGSQIKSELAEAESNGEDRAEGNNCSKIPMAALKCKSQANKRRKSIQGNVHEIGDSGSNQQLLPETKIDNEVKPQGGSAGKTNGSVGSETEDLEPIEEAGKCVSEKPRKKRAPKYFRKKA